MKQEEIHPTISIAGNADKGLLSDEELSSSWLSALIDSADDAIISKTLDGIITSWNKGAERIFGYQAEEVIGKSVLVLIPPDHHNEEPEILGRIRAGERVEHYETIRVRKDGSLVDISLTVSPIRKSDGQIIGASKIARDVSALKQAQKTLRQSENQLRLITDAIPALISYVDEEHRYRFVNKAYTDWFGRSLEEIIGMHLAEIIGEAAYASVLPHIEKVFEGEDVSLEQMMPYLEGERIIHINYVPDFDLATGKVKGFCALVQDISESKKAETRLRESEERFAKAFSSSPLVLTISSLETGKLLEVNDTFVNTTGISRDEAIGKTTVELGLWAKAADREAEMETVRQNGHIRNAEYLFTTRKGDIVGLLSAEHIEIGGESFALTVIQDITEHKRAEQEREELLRREQIARQQAEEASRLKDEFLATVSHEIRTPLNAILGWSQMLRANKINPKDISGAVETIYRNAKSQAQLIEDILDVSRIITGKIRLEAQPISLAPVIQTAVESLRPAIEAKNILLQMHLNFEPRMVNADPNRVQQVVWNLLSYAIKFTPENGNVEIKLESFKQHTKIIVSDTGKGIDAEFLPFVFERFRQADGSSTRKHGGLGLGLAIVRHIVELHGGSVEVSSAGEGKGTTFTVLLPQAETVAGAKKNGGEIPAFESNPVEAQTMIADGKIKGLRVLLLDDETDTLELLSMMLSQSGAEVKSATTVADALEIIKIWKPGVIVSDIAMPGEDGYSFIKKLRALPREQGGSIPAIALTAYVGIKERTQVLSSGFQMYVPKPVEPSELVGALANFA